VMGANFKFANAGYPIHTALEAAGTLVRTHQLDASAISAVHVGMPANVLRVVDNRKMHNICVQDMVAALLLRGGLSLREPPFPAILDEPGFAAMRARVTTGVDPGLESDLPRGRGANVAITTTGGTRFEQRVDWPKGHSRRGGVTWDDLSAKWRDALPHRDIDRAVELARRLEDLDDARALADIFGD
jgi:2-methylcitrate dehydratase PrpD